ncbi:MAG: hypothetical protein JXA10_15045 [Anaerolineae bacterium]|nr:hypothetical protein [Anaerolineae bacterium]
MSKRFSQRRKNLEDDYNNYGYNSNYSSDQNVGYNDGPFKPKRQPNQGGQTPPLKDLARIAGLLEYPLAIPWAIAALIAAIMMVVTNLLNVTAFSSIIDLGFVPTWLLAVPFFAILFPFFLLLTAYQEGSSRAAIRQGIRDAFEIEFFIPNNEVMKITEIVVILFNILVLISTVVAGENAAAQGFIAFMSILAPFFAYASARFLATTLKIHLS